MDNRKNPFRGIVSIVVTLVMVGVLTLGLLGTATAATLPAVVRPNAVIGLDKLYTTDIANQWASGVTSFSFELTPVGYSGGPTEAAIAYDVNNLPMPTGTVSNVYTMNANGFSTTLVGDTQTKSVLDTGTARSASIPYTQMGVYTYNVSEKIPTTTVAGMVYDTNEYFLNVYVDNVIDSVTKQVVLDTNGNPLVTVSAITIYKNTNTADSANPSADNADPNATDGKLETVGPTTAGATTIAGSIKASVDMTNTYAARELIVDKTVTGPAGDTTMDFNFTVALTKPSADGTTTTTTADTATYSYSIYSKGDDGLIQSDGTGDDVLQSNGTITNGGTISIKHNQYYVIHGLPINEGVTVTEALADSQYTTSITSINDTLTDSRTNLTSARTVGKKAITSGINSQSFVNNKNSITPTGVWMNVWPYVLIALIAVLGGVLWLVSKRKKSQVNTQHGSGL